MHPTSSLLDAAGSHPSLSAAHRALATALPSDWLVYDEMVRIGVVAHVRTVTLVSPLTVLLLAGPMRLPLDALSEPSTRELQLLSQYCTLSCIFVFSDKL